jgi:hypothetical protein
VLDLSAASLFSGLILGVVGMALFVWGKQQQRPLALVAGIVVGGLPMLIHSMLWLWVVEISVLGGWAAVERAG